MTLIPSLTSFSAGTAIRSADVNANFTAIRNVVNGSVVHTDVATTITAAHTWSATQAFQAVTATTGAFSSTVTAGGDVTAPGFVSATGSQSCATGVTTTLFSLSTEGVYLVHAYVDSADVANYQAWAVVAVQGGAARILHQDNGGLLALVLSGLAVRATQTSGGTVSVFYGSLRLASS